MDVVWWGEALKGGVQGRGEAQGNGANGQAPPPKTASEAPKTA